MTYPTTNEIDAFTEAANKRFNPQIEARPMQEAAIQTIHAMCLNCGKQLRDWDQKYCGNPAACEQRAAFRQ